jgi:hypothetical protein
LKSEQQQQQFVELNSVNLSFHKIELKHENGVNQVINNQQGRLVYSKESQIVRMQFEEILKPGNAQLLIGFSGKLSDQPNGFYKTKCGSGRSDQKEYPLRNLKPLMRGKRFNRQ